MGRHLDDGRFKPVYGLRIAPLPTRVLLTILGATGLAELLNAATEALSWTGQVARKQAGQ